MRVFSAWLVPAFLSAALGVCAGQPANLTGTWHLNVAKSHWGSKPKPASVVLQIQHQEPALQYSGTVTEANEDGRSFTFTGAIDGKSYPMTGALGAGTAVLKRVDAATYETVFRSDDGTRKETARTSLSRNGRYLTRRIRLETPGDTKTWTEVYERR
ncbi:MAG TPA: hypothetical protein VN442_03020 [Bryobacteraceae bacterium]|nr:hypothetical protein [Bryobacteraceae bacterium]